MTTPTQDNSFSDEVIGGALLEKAIAWIQRNLDPEDVFTTGQLMRWARDNIDDG